MFLLYNVSRVKSVNSINKTTIYKVLSKYEFSVDFFFKSTQWSFTSTLKCSSTVKPETQENKFCYGKTSLDQNYEFNILFKLISKKDIFFNQLNIPFEKMHTLKSKDR